MQIAQRHAGTVAGRYIAQGSAGAPCQEILQPLRRGAVIAAAGLKGAGFNLPLPIHATQGTLVWKILRLERHQQRGVGIFAVPGGIAHAVGHHAAFLRGGGHHLSAGAHAEGVGRGAVGQMHIELVVRRGQ